MSLYSDEYLEYYADRFVERRLHSHGLTLEMYLSAPERYEHLAHQPEPLLVKQLAVAERLEQSERIAAAVEHLPRRNGTVMEPLKHHRNPKRNRSSRFIKKAEL